MTDLFEAEAATTTTLDMRRLQRNKRRASRRKWTLVASAVAIVVFALGASVAWNFVQGFQSTSAAVADYEGTGQGTLQVIVNPGDTGAEIATTLYDAGVIASRQAFLQEWASNNDAQSIVPGYYHIHREMKAEYALDALLDEGNRDVRTIQVTEGYNLQQIKQKIASVTGVSEGEVQRVMDDTEALGLPAEAEGNLEGWLFPATYPFNPGVTPTEVLTTMISTTEQKLEELGVAEGDRQDILTVASLIEKEARLDEDRPLVASVIYNRLAKEMPLQFDSTIKYFRPSEGIFTTDEDRAIDNPYNTYIKVGLPPGPIASPGEASLSAAVNPAETDYEYFVTVDPEIGTTKFTNNYPEHLKNTEELRAWYKEHDSEDS